jgi:hypothetical protein
MSTDAISALSNYSCSRDRRSIWTDSSSFRSGIATLSNGARPSASCRFAIREAGGIWVCSVPAIQAADRFLLTSSGNRACVESIGRPVRAQARPTLSLIRERFRGCRRDGSPPIGRFSCSCMCTLKRRFLSKKFILKCQRIAASGLFRAFRKRRETENFPMRRMLRRQWTGQPTAALAAEEYFTTLRQRRK